MAYNNSQNFDLNIVGKKSFKTLHSKLVNRDSESNNKFVISTSFLSSFINKATKDYHKAFDKDDDNGIMEALKLVNIENFLRYFINISHPEKDSYSYSSFYLDEYIFNDDEESLNDFIKDAYDSFFRFEATICDFQHRNIDKGYHFRHTDSNEHFAVIANEFRKNVIDKVKTIDEFKSVVMVAIDEFKEKKLDEIPAYDFDSNEGKVYLLPKDIDIEEIIKSSKFPEIVVMNLIGVKMKSLDQYDYLFSKYKQDYKEHGFSEYSDLKISVYPKGHYFKRHGSKVNIQQTYFYYEKDMVLFTNRSDAESYYKDKLIEVRNKIDDVLKTSVLF